MCIKIRKIEQAGKMGEKIVDNVDNFVHNWIFQ